MGRLTQIARQHRGHFHILLVILWLALVTNQLVIIVNSTGIQDNNKHDVKPSVSVRMSTSIVESANYQPADPTDQISATQTTIPSHQEHHFDHRYNHQERSSRFFGGQDSLTARNDKSTQSSITHLKHHDTVQSNEAPLFVQVRDEPHMNAGKILDPSTGGYRYSVSTSRALTPPAIQVLSKPVALTFNQAPPGHRRAADKTLPAEHKLVESSHQRGLVRRILDGGHQAIVDMRCEGRGVGKMLKNAKNMIQERAGSSIEEHSGLLIIGSSLLAASIPLAVLYTNAIGVDSSVSPPNRRASPATGEGPLSFVKHLSLQSRVDSMMGWIERSVEHLPSFPRLHPQECVKRSICEAHNEPGNYGAIGFILRLLFPASNLNSTDRMDNMEYKVINKYRHAAGYGLTKRIDSNGTNVSACKEKYEDCLISLLDVARGMMDLFLR